MQNKHWQALVEHQASFTKTLPALFQQDESRFQRFSLEACGILFDYSKQRIEDKSLDLLLALAEDLQLEKHRQALFAGEKINQSEGQPALHSALRDFSPEPLLVDGKDIKKEIQAVLLHLEQFAEILNTSYRSGASNKSIQDIICLGIGGSELGPALVCEALKDYKTTHLKMHFVSNVDGKTISEVLNALNPETTFCIISSKTFTTPETLQNAKIVKDWLRAGLNTKAGLNAETGLSADEAAAKHLFAATAAVQKAIDFGIPHQNIFEFWRWVGGRYSIWSAVGLPAILSMGMTNFKEFLAGANEMDQHFQKAPLRENMPVLMALLSVWNRNFWNYKTQAIIPYDDALAKLPSYIQQLEMESNGKSVGREGEELSYATAPVIWGGVGCNAQHAFMQLLHQGSDIIPVDFLIAVEGREDLPVHQKMLLANCFAQSKALMEGYQIPIQDIHDIQMIKAKECPGNRPSSTLIYPKLSPRILGALLALFEHKVFVQGVVWGINSFDQWGVELGKTLAKNIAQHLESQSLDSGEVEKALDSSTLGLLQFVKSLEIL